MAVATLGTRTLVGHGARENVPEDVCSYEDLVLHSCHRCSALAGHSPRGHQGSRNRSGRLRRYALAGWTTLVSDEGTRLRPRSASISDGRIRGSKAPRNRQAHAELSARVSTARTAARPRLIVCRWLQLHDKHGMRAACATQ